MGRGLGGVKEPMGGVGGIAGVSVIVSASASASVSASVSASASEALWAARSGVSSGCQRIFPDTLVIGELRLTLL